MLICQTIEGIQGEGGGTPLFPLEVGGEGRGDSISGDCSRV